MKDAKKGFTNITPLHHSEIREGLEVITNTGDRFLVRNGYFCTGNGRHALSPEMFHYFTTHYGGGKAYKATDLDESFVESARLSDRLTREHDERRMKELGIGNLILTQ